MLFTQDMNKLQTVLEKTNKTCLKAVRCAVLEGERVEMTEEFTYLGHILTMNNDFSKEMSNPGTVKRLVGYCMD